MFREIYKGTSDDLELRIYKNGSEVDADETPQVTVTRDGEVVASGPALDTGMFPPVYTYDIGLDLTQQDGKLFVRWDYVLSGKSGTQVDVVEVVTPYVTVDEIRESSPELANKSYDELRAMERRVRQVIDAYTGMSFGSYEGTILVPGNGTKRLPLDDRIYRLDQISIEGEQGNHALATVVLSIDGYVILHDATAHANDLKRDVFPHASEDVFKRGAVYKVTGGFGYQHVPNDINLAAKMLINDYFCNESSWRTRGISSVRAADWRFEFGPKAFSGTGNIDVDHILDSYKTFRAVII